SLALVAYILLAVVEGAVRAEHGAVKIDEEQSTYHVGNEIVRSGGDDGADACGGVGGLREEAAETVVNRRIHGLPQTKRG
ncbi:MAG: hypothetical protein RMJ98_08060, partial [Myxococcales bacterium]|nr:hypothetical protein [Myxococcales bacterium]